MTGFWQDVRYAVRMLVKSPGFTAVVVVAMGLGIGANTMIFSVVNAILMRELPLPDSDRVVVISTQTPQQDRFGEFSYPDLIDLRARTKTLESTTGYYEGLALVNFGGEAERLRNAMVTSGLMHTLGMRPFLGRDFLPEEEQDGRQLSTVIISHRVWRDRLKSDPGVIGRTLRINSRVRTIVGVMPPDIRFPEVADFWLPLGYVPAEDLRNERYLDVVARMAPGVTLDRASAEIGTMAGRLEAENPETNRGVRFGVMSYREELGYGARPMMIMLMCAVVFVLLIACANVANLMLARATVRAREMSLRAALGAGRGRLARQLLTESMMIGLLGGGVGVLVAIWSNDLVLSTIPIELPWWMKFGIDRTALGFTVLVALASGVLFGLAPVVQLSSVGLYDTLRETGGQSTPGRAHRRMRNGLVVAEIALSLVLLAGAGLMIRSFLRMQEIRGGIRPEGLLTGRLTLPVAAYPDAGDRRRFFSELVHRIAALPGVAGVSATGQLPYGDDSWMRPVMRQGAEAEPDEKLARAYFSPILPGFFATLEIPQRLGRDFNASDGPDAPRVAIVNESAARVLWPDEEPLGKRLRFGARDTLDWATVVGVVGDVRQIADNERVRAQVYVPHAQEPYQSMSLVVRGRSQPGALAAPIRRLIRERDDSLPFYDVYSLSEAVRLAMWESRLYAQLMGYFALVALVIAAVGIYGVMAYNVAHRTQEIGIRMAMGAAQETVLRMVIFQGMRLTAIGLGIGLAAAFGVTRLMANLLFGVSASDPPTFLGVILILAGSALLACWLPARRATRVDPMVALRSE